MSAEAAEAPALTGETEAELILETGEVFRGRSFGAVGAAVEGEVVFSTGMGGYVEALTDPSFEGQLLVLTYPLEGNYGVPQPPWESSRIHPLAVIASRCTRRPSHATSELGLSEWMTAFGVPGLEGIDTRRLTRRLRSRGTLRGRLRSLAEVAQPVRTVEMRRAAELACRKEVTRYPGGEPTLLVIDTGAKESLVDALHRRGASLIRAPFHARWEQFLGEVDGVMLTNGPGDPQDLQPLIARVRPLLSSGLPLLGVCLGHQLLALAAGAETYKLPFGHRSHNQPVLHRASGRAYLTSQNHGYAVRESSLPVDFESWFVNLNDRTNEGLRHAYAPIRSVQFHPEGAPGPTDTAFLFDEFLRIVGELRRDSRHGRARLRSSTASG